MSKRAKRLQKLRQNPKDVSFEDLKQIIEDYGFSLDRVVGSHHVFRAEWDDRVWKLTIPYKKPVKIIYVKQAINAIDEIIKLKPLEEESDGND